LEFFKEERDVWIQNISDTQLSMQFEIAPGQSHGVCIPPLPSPVCLTQEVPWDALKKSMDFRRFLNKAPPVMKLLTQDDVNEYYAKKAQAMNAFVPDGEGGQVPNVAAAMQEAEMERKRLTTREVHDDGTKVGPDGQVMFSPPRTAQDLMEMNTQQHMGVPQGAAQAAGLQHVAQAYTQQGQDGVANMGVPANMQGQSFNPQAAGFVNVGDSAIGAEQPIRPRILNLCQQVSMQIPANQRMPADEFYREVQTMGATLNMAELQHIEAHGTYKTVKRWAKNMQATRAAEEQGEGLEDGLELPAEM
jgi:hypothetical protein